MTTPHLRLVPEVTTDDLRQLSSHDHPSTQFTGEVVFQWHGLVEHELGETACCRQPLQVTNLIGDAGAVVEDLGAVLSHIIHSWNGCDVTVMLTVTPPGVVTEGPVWPGELRSAEIAPVTPPGL